MPQDLSSPPPIDVLRRAVNGHYVSTPGLKSSILKWIDEAYNAGITDTVNTWRETVEQYAKTGIGDDVAPGITGMIRVDMHRWYAVLREGDEFLAAIIQDTDGLWWTKDAEELERWLAQ